MDIKRGWSSVLLGSLCVLGLAACGGKGGNDTPAPVVTLTSSPSTIVQGGSSTLTWSSSNAGACTASGAWSGTRAVSGSETVTPAATGSASYTLQCTGTGGSGSATTTITVNTPAPAVTIAASPSTVNLGSATTLTWSSTNATSCVASEAWSGARDPSGSERTTATAAGTQNYTLTCAGPGGSGAATAAVTVTSLPSARLNVNGRVIDAPIPNASVTASVGTRTFIATADAEGYYTLQLVVPLAETAQLVSLAATGSSTQPTVRFTSLPGSFDALQAAAGSDGTLTNAENFRVNITNLSTAEAALLGEANGNRTPATDTELSRASLSLDQAQVVDIATVIKLVVDNGVALPAGAGDTLQLASSADLRNPFIEQQRNGNTAAFASAQASLLADPAVTIGATSASVPRIAYSFVAAASNEQTLLGDDRDVHSFTFNADGSGSYSDVDVFTDTLRWTVDASGSIAVRFGTNPGVTYRIFGSNLDGSEDITCRYEITAIDIRPISTTAAAHRIRTTTTCPSSPENSSSSDETRSLTFVTPQQLPALAASDVAGRSVTVRQLADDSAPNNFEYGSYYADDIASFNPDGTGSVYFFDGPFTWAAEPDGTIRVAYQSGVTARYRLIRALSGQALLLLGEFETQDGTFTDSFAAFPRNDGLHFTLDNAPGVYYRDGIGETDSVAEASGAGNAAERALLKGTAFEYFASGGATAELHDRIDHDASGNPLRVALPTTPEARRVWGIYFGDSLASVLYAPSRDGTDRECTFGTTDSGCIIDALHYLIPVASVGDRWVVLDAQMDIYSPPTDAIIARYYDYAPPGDWLLARDSSRQAPYVPAARAKKTNAKVLQTTRVAQVQRCVTPSSREGAPSEARVGICALRGGLPSQLQSRFGLNRPR